MSAKKRFLTIQYRMKRITAQDVANMIKIGSVTEEDIPDNLKEEVEEMLNAKSDSNKA